MISIFNNSIATLVTYVGFISVYFLLIPLILFYWMYNRWNFMGKYERFFVSTEYFDFFKIYLKKNSSSIT